MFSNPQKQLEKAHFDLRFAGKQMERMSKKAEQEAKANQAKVKKAIEQGNSDNARIYAENAIRKKQEATNFLRMSARLDATSQRVQTAITMNKVSKSMGTAVKGMDAALKSMDLVKITAIMDKFESQFEDLDVQTGVMEGAMQSTVVTSVPEDQVENLIQKVADEHGLELDQQLNEPQMGQALPTITNAEEAELKNRLKALREMDE